VIERILRHLGLWEAGRQVESASDSPEPAELVIEPWLDNPFPDYDPTGLHPLRKPNLKLDRCFARARLRSASVRHSRQKEIAWPETFPVIAAAGARVTKQEPYTFAPTRISPTITN